MTFSFDPLRSVLLKLSKNRNVKYGIPFVLFVVGGSFGLKYFASLRYEYSKVSAVSREEMEELNKFKKEYGQVFSLEAEYEKLKELDIDNWVNIRGPRPWEEEPNKEPQNNIEPKIMFDSESALSDSELEEKPLPKKTKCDGNVDRTIHSSLTYSTLKAPPLVEYKNIEGYCERNILTSECVSSTSNLQNISSPVVLKIRNPTEKRILPFKTSKPHLFFSIEELSLVKCLRNWKNTNVCPVGIVSMDRSVQECYINSVMEKGNWRLLLDTSLLAKIPDFQKLLQAYGTLEVHNEIPRLKVKFCRSLESIDLPRFIDSYRLMAKYIPVIEDSPTESEEVSNDEDTIVGATLSNTLDDYSFSNIL